MSADHVQHRKQLQNALDKLDLPKGVPFAGGVITCGEAFRVGRVLGDLAFAAFNASPDREHAAKIEPMVEWAHLEALRFAIEMQQMCESAHEVTQAMPALSGDPARRLKATEELSAWVSADLISNRHPFHQASFNLGYQSALTYTLLYERATEMLSAQELSRAASLIRQILKGALRHSHSSQGRVLQRQAYTDLVEYLAPYFDMRSDRDEAHMNAAVDAIADIELISAFPETIVRGIDTIVPVVLHTSRPAFPGVVDWEWLRAGVRAMFEGGDLWPAIIFTQDGVIGSGYLEDGLKRLLTPLLDPDFEVYLLDESSRTSIAVKKTWSELKALYLAKHAGGE